MPYVKYRTDQSISPNMGWEAAESVIATGAADYYTLPGQIVLPDPTGGVAPAGFTYFMDADGSRLTDADGAYLMEAL